MIQINTTLAGFPQEEATQLLIRSMPFELHAKTSSIYWELISVEGNVLANGNLELNENEHGSWGIDDSIIESVVLEKLGLTLKQI